MTYELNAAAVRLADLAPSRPPDEVINQLFAKGAVSIGSMTGPTVDSEITSPSGNLANVPYQNLRLSLSLADKMVRVTTLKLKAFAGDIVATGNTRTEASAPMEASINFTNLDIQQALNSQKSKAAGTVRGTLGGNITVSDKDREFRRDEADAKGQRQADADERQAGRRQRRRPGAQEGAAPAGDRQPGARVGRQEPSRAVRQPGRRHPDRDDELVLADPRITSHDIKVQTQDYNLLGDGWFDMDKNIDLAARIVLSPQFSKELIEQKKEVGFIANKDGQIDIPLQVVGQLPKPQVIAQRDGTRAARGNQRDARAGSKISRQSLRQERAAGRIGEISRRRLGRMRIRFRQWRRIGRQQRRGAITPSRRRIRSIS